MFTHIFERKTDQYFWWDVEVWKNVCFGHYIFTTVNYLYQILRDESIKN